MRLSFNAYVVKDYTVFLAEKDAKDRMNSLFILSFARKLTPQGSYRSLFVCIFVFLFSVVDIFRNAPIKYRPSNSWFI